MSDIALRQNILSELNSNPVWMRSISGCGQGRHRHPDQPCRKLRRGQSPSRSWGGSKACARRAGDRVRLASNKKTATTDCQTGLKIIAWDTTIPNDKIRLKVENGWVTLSGVEWNFHRGAEESRSQAVRHIRRDQSHTVRPRANISDVSIASKRPSSGVRNRRRPIRITVADSRSRFWARCTLARTRRGGAGCVVAPGVTAVRTEFKSTSGQGPAARASGLLATIRLPNSRFRRTGRDDRKVRGRFRCPPARCRPAVGRP